MDAVQKHFLEAFYPLSRPAVEHEVELPSVVEDMHSQLLKCKASDSLVCLQVLCVRYRRLGPLS